MNSFWFASYSSQHWRSVLLAVVMTTGRGERMKKWIYICDALLVVFLIYDLIVGTMELGDVLIVLMLMRLVYAVIEKR